MLSLHNVTQLLASRPPTRKGDSFLTMQPRAEVSLYPRPKASLSSSLGTFLSHRSTCMQAHTHCPPGLKVPHNQGATWSSRHNKARVPRCCTHPSQGPQAREGRGSRACGRNVRPPAPLRQTQLPLTQPKAKGAMRWSR